MKTVVNNNKNNIINKFKIQERNRQKRGLARFYVAIIIIIIVIINFIYYSSLLTRGQFNKTFTSVSIVFRV